MSCFVVPTRIGRRNDREKKRSQKRPHHHQHHHRRANSKGYTQSPIGASVFFLTGGPRPSILSLELTGRGGAAPSSESAVQVMSITAVRKQLPGGRELFGESSLSFNHGAKIGVLGVNGSGKSTVLKILAGVGNRQCSVL